MITTSTYEFQRIKKLSMRRDNRLASWKSQRAKKTKTLRHAKLSAATFHVRNAGRGVEVVP
jgi:hypothetical protein